MEVLHIFFSCSGEFLIISAFITISATTVLSNFTSSTDNLIKFVAKQDCDTTKNDIRQNFYFLQNWRFAVLFSLRQLNLWGGGQNYEEFHYKSDHPQFFI